jgi:hypothetical protein
MTRTTRKSLDYQTESLNLMLGRPSSPFASKPGEYPLIWNAGHIALDHNSYGYQLEEHSGDSGGTHNITTRLTAKEMDAMLRGIMKGISLQKQSSK